MRKAKTNVADRCDLSGKSGLKPYVVGKNRTFNTVKEVCKHLRISVSYFYLRYTVTETEEGRIVAKKTYKDLKGREFDTWRDLCNANGYSYSFCRNYKVKSSDFDSEHFNFEKVKALDENSRKPSPLDYHAIPVTVEGVRYDNIMDACKDLDLSPSYTIVLKRKYNMSFEDAILMQLHKVRDHQGNYFRTYKDMCKFHKISYSTFMHKLYLGFPLEKCLTLQAKRTHVDLQGREFKCWNDLCKANGYSFYFLTMNFKTSEHSDSFILAELEKEKQSRKNGKK